jgi:hypothetical protein
MHTSALDLSMFAVEVDGEAGSVDDVFLGWTPLLDRIGIVVHRPLEVIGASMLISLGIANFFAKGGRDEDGTPLMYAEIYLFDVGGSHGDPGFLDFVPAEKEVVIDAEGRPDRVANRVLSEVNAHGITRLLVPDGPPAPTELNGYMRGSAACRLRSVYAYSRDGHSVQNPDIAVRGVSTVPERNVAAVLDGPRAVRQNPRYGDPDDVEYVNWVERIDRRSTEVPDDVRATVQAERDDLLVDGTATELYRREDLDFALSRLVPTRALVAS